MMDTQSYNVGQILYVIPEGKPRIVPVQILEKRTSETLEGVSMVHIVKGPKSRAEPLQLESIKGDVFLNIDEVRCTMLENSKRAIDEMINRAGLIAKKAFQAPKQQQQESTQSFLEEEDDGLADDMIPSPAVLSAMTSSERVEVNMGNGEVAHVKLIPPLPID